MRLCSWCRPRRRCSVAPDDFALLSQCPAIAPTQSAASIAHCEQLGGAVLTPVCALASRASVVSATVARAFCVRPTANFVVLSVAAGSQPQRSPALRRRRHGPLGRLVASAHSRSPPLHDPARRAAGTAALVCLLRLFIMLAWRPLTRQVGTATLSGPSMRAARGPYHLTRCRSARAPATRTCTTSMVSGLSASWSRGVSCSPPLLAECARASVGASVPRVCLVVRRVAGGKVISLANECFKFNGWNNEIRSMNTDYWCGTCTCADCVLAPQYVTGCCLSRAATTTSAAPTSASRA